MRRIFLLLILGLISSCVGTIEESAQIEPSVEAKLTRFNFDGATQCEAISHDKAVVYFPKASVTFGSVNAEDMIYQVFQDGNYDQSVASSPASTLIASGSGYLQLIKNLTKNTDYTFNVRVFDPTSGDGDENFKQCKLTTLTSELPDFSGLEEVKNYPGLEGRTSLLLSWNKALPAKYIIGTIPESGYAIRTYNIYVGKDANGLELLTSLTVSESSHPTSFQVGGLTTGVNYFFKVNAVDESGRGELNNIVLFNQTNQPGSIEFAGVTSAEAQKSDAGYNSLIVTWPQASGDFNAYKIFAVPESHALYNSTSIDSNNTELLVGSAIRDTTALKSVVQGLEKNTKYRLFVVACEIQGTACTTVSTIPKGTEKSVIAETSPPLAPFGGIYDIDPQSGVAGLSQATVKWNAPSSIGVCESITLKNASGNEAIKTCFDETDNSKPCLNKLPTCSDTETIVLNMTTDVQYCFEAVLTANGVEQDPSSVVRKCHVPKFEKPVFPLPPTCTVTDNSITVNWNFPDPEGMYEGFLIAFKIDNGGPSESNSDWWSKAKSAYEQNSSSEYSFKEAPSNVISWRLKNLIPEAKYNLMVKTYVNLGTNAYDDNLNLITCTTKEMPLEFSKWNSLWALGPKVSKEGTATDESLVASVIGAYNHYVVTSGTGGDEGIVLFDFDDFVVGEDRVSLSSFAETVPNRTAADGYYVFRSVTPPPVDLEARKLMLNTLNETTPGWTRLNSDPIEVDLLSRKIVYIDQISGNVHPFKESWSDHTLFEQANRSRSVWYAIKYKLGGKFLSFGESSSISALVDVILPPANMALVHRWAANSKMCRYLQKESEIDPVNDFRCQYDGLGSLYDSATGLSYYDINGHVLVDRFDLACDAKNINLVSNVSYTKGEVAFAETGDCFVYADAVDRSLSYANYNFDDKKFFTDIYDGAITSYNYNLFKKLPTSWYINEDRKEVQNAANPTADKSDFIIYDPFNKAICFKGINTTTSTMKSEFDLGNYDFSTCRDRVYLVVSSVFSGTFELGYSAGLEENTFFHENYSGVYLGTKYFEDGYILNKTTSLFPAKLSEEALGRRYNTIPQNDADLGLLYGAGDKITANYPSDFTDNSVSGVTHSAAHYLCESHNFVHKSGVSSTKPIRKRLISSRELLTIKLPHQSLANPTDRDSVYTSGNIFFGVQDFNTPTYVSGQALCNKDGDGKGLCSTAPSSSVISAYQTQYNGNAEYPFYKYKSAHSNFPDQEIYTNGRGANYFWYEYDNREYLVLNSGEPDNIHFGVPKFTDQRFFYVNSDSVTESAYFYAHLPRNLHNISPVIGEMLWCNYASGSCTTDDNISFSQLTGALSDEADKFYSLKYETNSDIHAGSVIPMAAYYNPKQDFTGPFLNNANLVDPDSGGKGGTIPYFNYQRPDGTVASGNLADMSSIIRVQWTPLYFAASKDVEVRCAVKLLVDETGAVVKIDGIEKE